MTNHENWEKVKEVCDRLIEAGFETYLVGGCVRDSLLHRSINDFDVATSASPKQVHDLFERVILVGEAFGVCRVILENISAN